MLEKVAIQASQEDLMKLVTLVTEENKSYELAGERASAVLISQSHYESLQETIELLSMPGLRESLQKSLEQVAKNETYSLDDVLGDVD